jgi:hypothetical protein
MAHRQRSYACRNNGRKDFHIENGSSLRPHARYLRKRTRQRTYECRDTVRAASIACTVAVRLAETLFALGDVALAWTIREGARMAAVRAHHIFR